MSPEAATPAASLPRVRPPPYWLWAPLGALPEPSPPGVHRDFSKMLVGHGHDAPLPTPSLGLHVIQSRSELQGRPPHPSLPPTQAATPQAPRAPSCWVSAGLCSDSPSLEVTESLPALRWVSAQMSASHRATLLSGFILSHSTYWLLTSGTYSHFSPVSLARTQAPG